ncbi:MAG: YggT family protein [Xanthomonadales bacterium]|jgi:YggT family protein|nr:YggT family protein [Xanthomonadales bacterium]
MNTTGAVSYLIGTLIDLYITAVMLRLLLQWVRADFYNPVCQFLVLITNPLLIPLRRVIPSIGRLDTASVVLMLVLELLGVWLLTQFFGRPMDGATMVLFALVKLILTLLWTYFFLIIALVILSWVGPRARHPIVPLIFQLTDPVLAPIRRFIPPIGGFDLAPLVALIAIRFLIVLLPTQF